MFYGKLFGMSHKSPPSIAEITASLSSPDSNVTVTGLVGSAPAYILNLLAATAGQTFLVIAPDTDSAEEIHRELQFYSTAQQQLLFFPPWEADPFEHQSPHPNVVGERLGTLLRLLDNKPAIVVTTVAAVMQKIVPQKVLSAGSEYLIAGDEVDREGLVRKLANLGYSHVPLVEDRATYSVRGGIVDIFPPDIAAPVRIEFFGDFIESIRNFDPLTQRSLDSREDLVLMPSREIILSEPVLKTFSIRLKERCDELGLPVARRRELLEQMQQGIYPPGIEYLQPLFHQDLETLFDYLGQGAVKVILDPFAVEAAVTEFATEIEAGLDKAEKRDDITPERDDLFLRNDDLERRLKTGCRLTIPSLILEGDASKVFTFSSQTNSDLRVEVTSEGELLRPLIDKLRSWVSAGDRVVITCHNRGQAQRIHDLLIPYGVPITISSGHFSDPLHDAKRVEVILGDLSRGFRMEGASLVIIAEEEIFGKRAKRRSVTELRKKQILTSLAELKPGDLMVHIDHGVGIYRGLQHLKLAASEGDFVLLEYAGQDKLYLPVDRLNLVQRYVGAEGVEPKVDRLGGSTWEKAKARAREAIEEMAEELLKIYAERQVQKGHAFTPPDEIYREFEASFAFEETPDQLSAIEDVIRDMESDKPMDRLVCGDVGYGKTEVAMRGAFKSVMDGKQVAVLVPTTILAQQHMETFRERLKAYPVKVEMLSRFRSPKEQKVILEQVKKGDIDIIIGTHRLLQADVAFKDLGLLIIDEEQRFGVVHKEKLKKYRAVVDIMTLTATPIPRTLYMSLMGIRDLSIIDTPPVDRLSIKTYVSRFTDDVIREGIMRELQRGGQVFFVHNRVQTIGGMAEHLQKVVPEAKIAVAHGQMDEKELEQVMLDFMHGKYNLLLCTTIIESGLDIPSANTLIVNRADTFGLSQLYQLRGRVGRSKQRAHAYFLIPGEGAITADARERLRILQELTELGAGFRIATHDLEIRGAGDLLGGRQSGQIAAVGFELYTELMEEAIRRLKGEELVERVEPEINLGIPAFIPEDYIRDPNQRLVIYKKLTQAANEEDVLEVKEELADRFGALPLAATYLLEVMTLRLLLKKFLVKSADFDGGRKITFAFHQKTPISPDRIIALIRQFPKRYQFTPDYRLVCEIPSSTFEHILAEARNVLKSLV